MLRTYEGTHVAQPDWSYAFHTPKALEHTGRPFTPKNPPDPTDEIYRR